MKESTLGCKLLQKMEPFNDIITSTEGKDEEGVCSLYNIHFRKSGALASTEKDQPLFSVTVIAVFKLVVLYPFLTCPFILLLILTIKARREREFVTPPPVPSFFLQCANLVCSSH